MIYMHVYCSQSLSVLQSSPTKPISKATGFFCYLVVALTKEFESLGSLVHKDSIQMTGLYRADLYGFLPPAHDLI